MITKEKYFSSKTIDSKALEIIENVKNTVERTKKQEFFPQSSALIVIDMQKYFCEENSHAFIPSSRAIIPKIKLLTESCKAKNLPVIFTQHINSVENAGMMKNWWREIISEDLDTCQIIPELNQENSYLIKKPQYSAFYNTDLEDYLRINNISQLVITGVATHLCCETTARDAFARGFKTFLCVDSTATYNQKFHESSILNLSHGFSDLTLSDEICRKIQS